jgi:hypothetical protein
VGSRKEQSGIALNVSADSQDTTAMNNRSVPTAIMLPHLVYRNVAEACEWPFQPYALAPDGKRFAVSLYSDGTMEQRTTRHLTFLLNFTDELRRRVPAQ